MHAFLNDPKNKEDALVRAHAQPVSKEGIDYFSYEDTLGIPKEVGYWEDVILGELPTEDAKVFPAEFLKAVPVGADLSTLPARFMLWQFEDARYGLKNIRAVRKDAVLMGFCDELAALYRREIGGTPIAPQELQELFDRTAAAWAVIGDRQRIASMRFARKWAWLGARKWAWIPIKGWTSTWKWLLAATRNRARSGATIMLLSWADAFKWIRPWESSAQRVRIGKAWFLSALQTAFTRA
jgi:hypothetical protein